MTCLLTRMRTDAPIFLSLYINYYTAIDAKFVTPTYVYLSLNTFIMLQEYLDLKFVSKKNWINR